MTQVPAMSRWLILSMYKGKSRPTQSQPTQGRPKVVEPEALGGVVAGPLKQTKRDAPKVAGLDSVENVNHGSLQTSKRKSDHDLGSETTKKSKIGHTTFPSAPKRGGFFNSIQLPGYTAAPPTVSIASTPLSC